MRELLSQVIPVALGAAVSPVLLTVTILILSGRHYQKVRAASFITGAALDIFLVGIIGLSVGNLTLPKAPPLTLGAIDIGLGILLILLGIKRIFSKNNKKGGTAEEDDQSPKYKDNLLKGMAIMGVNFTTWVLYVEAIKIINVSDLNSVQQLILLLIVITIVLLPAIIPLIIYLVIPGRAQQILNHIYDFLQKYSRYIAFVIFLIFGIYLIVKGINTI